MQHSTKQKVLLAFVVASLIFYVCTFLLTTNTVTNVSAVDTSHGVGVYEDSDCSDIVEEIPWGTLYPGSVKNKEVYIRNNKTDPMYLILNTTKWDPLNASDFLELTWNYTMTVLAPEDVIAVKLTLSVSPDIKGISSFSFDILVAGSDSLLLHACMGDVNGDCVVNILDVTLCCINMGPVPPMPPQYDINEDGSVNILDVTLCCINIG